MIPQSTIDKIYESANIEEIVGDFVTLKKTGANYKGRCPFHDEKTPSFVVSPTKGIYKCFGCGKGGNSVSFVQEIQNVSFPDALRYIANKYNIEIIEENLTKEQELRLSKKESQFIATKFAEEYFQDILWNSEEGKKIGLSYFKERKFSHETIKKFKLGYSPKKQNSFHQKAIKSGFDKKILIECSLVGENENGKTYDKFRERAIFPIHSYNGKPIGFGGRSFDNNAKSKYVNSNETLIYEKSKILYGIHLAKQDASKSDLCYIVEGYTDVVSMHENGVKNVVSASGTALSNYQIKLIKRSTKNIVLLFDGDEAGTKATIRSIDVCLKEEMNVQIVSFPQGDDPDSLSQKLSTKDFKEYLNSKSINFVDYLINIYSLNEENNPSRIVEIKKKIILSISHIPDVLAREEYCRFYYEKLGLTEQSLLREVTLARSQQRNKNITDPSSIKSHPIESVSAAELKLENLEKEVIRLLVNYGNELILIDNEKVKVAHIILQELNHDNITFSNKNYQDILSIITDLCSNDLNIEIKDLVKNADDNIRECIINLVSQAYHISENWKNQHKILTGRENEKMQKTIEKAILALKKGIVGFKIYILQKKMKDSELSKNEILQLNNLVKLKTKISKFLGRNLG